MKQNPLLWGGVIIALLFATFSQVQLSQANTSLNDLVGPVFVGNLGDVDITKVSSTAQALEATFPELKSASNQDEIVAILLAKGNPEYSDALGGITFDDPVKSLEYLSKRYPSLKKEVQEQDPETWQRYLNLAAAPRGISCEFCCGVGPQGIDSRGNLRCGCAHNPAAQAIALGLMSETDYTDAEVLREVMRWKSIFFPRDMVSLALKVSEGDQGALSDNLPGMVGGC